MNIIAIQNVIMRYIYKNIVALKSFEVKYYLKYFYSFFLCIVYMKGLIIWNIQAIQMELL